MSAELFDSLQASVTCAATGPLRIRDVNKISGPEGGEVFSEQKGLNLFQNKVAIPNLMSKEQQQPQDSLHTHIPMRMQTLRVRRVYDQKHNTLVYTAYATRFQNSVSTGISPCDARLDAPRCRPRSYNSHLTRVWHADL